MSSTVAAILHRAVEGSRLCFDEGVELFRSGSLLELGQTADAVCRRLHPEPYRTYNIDRNINYTNVCTAVCDFCAFYRKVDDTEALVYSYDCDDDGVFEGDLGALDRMQRTRQRLGERRVLRSDVTGDLVHQRLRWIHHVARHCARSASLEAEEVMRLAHVVLPAPAETAFPARHDLL